MARRVFLQKLYNPIEAGHDCVDIDIVLVHGLDGDPVSTWQDDKSGKVWPRDLLPHVLPRSRVLSFAYNGDMYRNQSVASIRDNARTLLSYLKLERRREDPARPIVFVAHCLGGLIVKHAMYVTQAEREFAVFSEAPIGILFFGTPHSGTTKDNWDKIARTYSAIDRALGRRSTLVDNLLRNSEALADVNEKFRQISDDYRITSFFETVKWRNTDTCIVDQCDAVMLTGGEKTVAVPADHAAMCWFDDEKDINFRLLVDEIEENAKPLEDDLDDIGGDDGWPGGVVLAERRGRQGTIHDASVQDMVVVETMTRVVFTRTQTTETQEQDWKDVEKPDTEHPALTDGKESAPTGFGGQPAGAFGKFFGMLPSQGFLETARQTVISRLGGVFAAQIP